MRIVSSVHDSPHERVSCLWFIWKTPFPRNAKEVEVRWMGRPFFRSSAINSTNHNLPCRTLELRINNFFLVLLSQTGAVAAMSVQEYFPEIGNDLTVVTWGHAVNSQQKLQAALTGKKNPWQVATKNFISHCIPCTTCCSENCTVPLSVAQL